MRKQLHKQGRQDWIKYRRMQKQWSEWNVMHFFILSSISVNLSSVKIHSNVDRLGEIQGICLSNFAATTFLGAKKVQKQMHM